MKISLDTPGHAYLIHAYSQGEIRVRRPAVSQAVGADIGIFHQSLIIAAGHLITDWPPQRFDELAPHHFDVLEEIVPELVLIGTGARLRLPSPPVLAPLIRQGVGFEVMDTSAACRTYNLLVGEGRKVAAALLIG